jgi:hypothetical protein
MEAAMKFIRTELEEPISNRVEGVSCRGGLSTFYTAFLQKRRTRRLLSHLRVARGITNWPQRTALS